jgi:hypothetical protein
MNILLRFFLLPDGFTLIGVNSALNGILSGFFDSFPIGVIRCLSVVRVRLFRISMYQL